MQRYTEISMYLYGSTRQRYTEIFESFAVLECKGIWKFPCTFVVLQYMEISKCLLATEYKAKNIYIQVNSGTFVEYTLFC